MVSFSNVETNQKLRLCLVKDKKALFHKWIHIKNIFGQEFESAIVEFEDGQVEEIEPNNIIFYDNLEERK